MKKAYNAIKGDEALLAKFAHQLADLYAAYTACMDKPGPVPSACEEGVATNPDGAGVCR